MSFKSVAVLGGGPIGLMCAIEARQKFVNDVTIVEKRGSYTRTNVPTLSPEIQQHFKKIGVADTLWRGAKGEKVGDSVAFSRIEEALWLKAQQAGVKMLRGYYVEGLMGREMKKNGRYKSIGLTLRRWDEAKKRPQRDEVGDKPGDNWRAIGVDLLIVASGGGAASDDVITRKLGFGYEKLKARNYGAFGIFDGPDDERFADSKAAASVNAIVGQKIAFKTPDHNYLLVTLSQITARDFERLKKDVTALSKILVGVSKVYRTNLLGDIKQAQKNLAVFEISIQRARQFCSPQYPAVLVGDASVTPHPDAGSGIGTGFKGFEELQLLIAALKGTHRSRDNRAAFMAFNDRYELHASRKALEGTDIVLGHILKMLQGFKDDVTRSSPGSSSGLADLQQRMLRTNDALLNATRLYQARTKEFLKILKEDNVLPADWRWNDTVGELWSEINSTYEEIESLTGEFSMLEDRLAELESKVKFK